MHKSNPSPLSRLKKILSILAPVLLVGIVYLSLQLLHKERESKIYKHDYATLHSTEFGLFNGDIWKTKMIYALGKKIEDFELNGENRAVIKGYVETIIDTLIVETERVVKERNLVKTGFFESLLGSTKQMIAETIIDFKDMRRRVPEFTDSVMIELEKEENQVRIRSIIEEKLEQFLITESVASVDMTPYNEVIKKYGNLDLETANKQLDTQMEQLSSDMELMMELVLGLSFLLILLVAIQDRFDTIALLLVSSTALTLLATGIMLPMLDIEAKISRLYFVIMDQPILFENQILFFQTKSISDLVRLLLESGEGKMILVGVLLMMFSVIFPTLKLIAIAIYYYGNALMASNPIVKFFALKSSKWSMADVMVVSIFMAFLGLDGVVESELRHLSRGDNPMNIITTNGTHLETGFYLFMGFVLVGFALSMLVEKHKGTSNTIK